MTFKQTALEALKYELNEADDFCTDTVNWLTEAIKIIDSIPEEHQWISIDDKLPESNIPYSPYLVSDWEIVWVDRFFTYKGWHNWQNRRDEGFVKYWMELPTPPTN